MIGRGRETDAEKVAHKRKKGTHRTNLQPKANPPDTPCRRPSNHSFIGAHDRICDNLGNKRLLGKSRHWSGNRPCSIVGTTRSHTPEAHEYRSWPATVHRSQSGGSRGYAPYLRLLDGHRATPVARAGDFHRDDRLIDLQGLAITNHVYRHRRIAVQRPTGAVVRTRQYPKRRWPQPLRRSD